MHTQLIGLPKCVKHFVRHHLGLGGGLLWQAAQPVQQHDELVPTKTRHRVAFTGATEQAGADLLQHGVAGIVAQGVIELLEVVNVQKHQGAVVSGARRGEPHLIEAVHQQIAIGQMGQGVMQCK